MLVDISAFSRFLKTFGIVYNFCFYFVKSSVLMQLLYFSVRYKLRKLFSFFFVTDWASIDFCASLYVKIPSLMMLLKWKMRNVTKYFD